MTETNLDFERLDGTKFRLTLVLQPSGDVLIECRSFDNFLCSYENVVMRNRYISNRMYARMDYFNLWGDELTTVAEACNALRRDNVNSWNSKYAPGPNFTGG